MKFVHLGAIFQPGLHPLADLEPLGNVQLTA